MQTECPYLAALMARHSKLEFSASKLAGFIRAGFRHAMRVESVRFRGHLVLNSIDTPNFPDGDFGFSLVRTRGLPGTEARRGAHLRDLKDALWGTHAVAVATRNQTFPRSVAGSIALATRFSSQGLPR